MNYRKNILITKNNKCTISKKNVVFNITPLFQLQLLLIAREI